MAAPVNDTYSNFTGTIRGGRGAGGGGGGGEGAVYPLWRSLIPDLTWAAIPNTKMRSVDPEADPVANPNYPGGAPWRGAGGQETRLTAWSSCVLDTDNDIIHQPLGGGRDLTGDNSTYYIDMSLDVPAWVRSRPPTSSPALTPYVPNILDDTLIEQGTGTYADDRPRATHAYYTCAYVPIAAGGLLGGKIVLPNIGQAMFPNGTGAARVTKAWWLNHITGEWTYFGNVAPAQGDGVKMLSVWCPDVGRLLHIVDGGGAGCLALIAPDGTVTYPTGRVEKSSGCPGAYIPGLQIVVMVSRDTGPFTSFDFCYYDASSSFSGNQVSPTNVVGTRPWDAASMKSEYGGAGYHTLSNKVFVYNPLSGSTHRVFYLEPPLANPSTAQWTWGEVTISPSNTVIPPAPSANGVLGSFMVSNCLNCLYYVPSVDSDVHVFALPVTGV
jgi:hypothetical protein